jgi:3-methyladenine DNA glycosylase AlkD
MWLNRSAILFQLSYKQKRMLISFVLRCLTTHSKKNFLFKKNNGWALRICKIKSEAVTAFVKNLKTIKYKEALKNIC